jgi:hypothetical protein
MRRLLLIVSVILLDGACRLAARELRKRVDVYIRPVTVAGKEVRGGELVAACVVLEAAYLFPSSIEIEALWVEGADQDERLQWLLNELAESIGDLG